MDFKHASWYPHCDQELKLKLEGIKEPSLGGLPHNHASVFGPEFPRNHHSSPLSEIGLLFCQRFRQYSGARLQ
jgi:hypothetical protein